MINSIKSLGEYHGTQIDSAATINKASNNLSNSIHDFRTTNASFEAKLTIITAEIMTILLLK